MKKVTIVLCVFLLSICNSQISSANDGVGLIIDPGQSSITFSAAGSSDSSSVSGTGEIDLGSFVVPFGTAQLTDFEGVLDDGFDISILGGLVSVSAEAANVIISMQTPGPAGTVDAASNTFSQFGNFATSTGTIEVFDPLGLAGGSRTIDLATNGPAPFDIQDAQLSLNGNMLTMALDLLLVFEVAPGVDATIDGSLIFAGEVPVAVAPTAVTVFRGDLQSGGLAEIAASDDSYMELHPGFTLTSSEAPVWLLFDAVLAADSPASLALSIESNANTPGLEYYVELYNFDTGSFEVIATEPASFNVDLTVDVCASGDLSRFAETGTGAIEARIGWYKTGFTIVFPWQVNIDQVGWFASN